MQLKVLYLAFYRKCSTKNLIFQPEKTMKKTETNLCLVERKLHFPNYVQLDQTTLILYEKRTFSVGYTELLS